MSSQTNAEKTPWRTRTAITMAVCGAVGLLVSFVLSIEALHVDDPAFSPACDVNTVISCVKVARTWQAQVLGFPNAFLGIAFDTVVVFIAVALATGGRLAPRLMLAVQCLYTLALGFALWLFWQAYAVIGVLCPWCLLILVTTILVWTSLTRINFQAGVLPLPEVWHERLASLVRSGADWTLAVAAIVVIAAMVVLKYGPSLLP